MNSPTPAHPVPELTAAPVHVVSTVAPGRPDQRLALILAILLTLGFVAAVPFARVPLPRWPVFIPAYEAALGINDLITATLLISQAHAIRSRRVLLLATGYAFTAFIAVPHTLTFPGLLDATGWLGAGPQTTAWLYMFWHGGFPLFVIGYALYGDAAPLRMRTGLAALVAMASVAMAVAALTYLATAGGNLLPPIMAVLRMVGQIGRQRDGVIVRRVVRGIEQGQRYALQRISEPRNGFPVVHRLGTVTAGELCSSCRTVPGPRAQLRTWRDFLEPRRHRGALLA